MAEYVFGFLAVVAAWVATALYGRERQRRVKLEKLLRTTQSHLLETQQLARIGTWEWDIEADQISWSEETFVIFGRRAGSGEPDFADILLSIHPEDAPAFDQAIQRAISEREVYRLDLRIRTPDGATKHIHAQGSPVTGKEGTDKEGTVTRIIGTVLDITERKEAERQLAEQATFDALTGLANRRHLLSQLDREMEVARRAGTALTFCICDLDRFKSINDTYGHLTGDHLLAEFGKLLSQEVRRGDVPARLGGDEFCFVFPRTDASQAKVVIERVRKNLQNRVFTTADGREFQVTSTFGIAQYVPGMTRDAFIEAADGALYSAKQGGRNQYVIAA